MVQLGDHFPAHQRRAFIESALNPGCVVRLTIKFPEITKPKVLVLVATDAPEFLTFIVNSEINPFIRKRPYLLQVQSAKTIDREKKARIITELESS